MKILRRVGALIPLRNLHCKSCRSAQLYIFIAYFKVLQRERERERERERVYEAKLDIINIVKRNKHQWGIHWWIQRGVWGLDPRLYQIKKLEKCNETR